MNQVTGDRIATPFTLFKIPGGANIADNFWRAGNLLANVDPENGTILRVLRGRGPSMEEFQQHPVTGQQLVGTRLPHWQRSEERRVGKSGSVRVDLGGRRISKKKTKDMNHD